MVSEYISKNVGIQGGSAGLGTGRYHEAGGSPVVFAEVDGFVRAANNAKGVVDEGSGGRTAVAAGAGLAEGAGEDAGLEADGGEGARAGGREGDEAGGEVGAVAREAVERAGAAWLRHRGGGAGVHSSGRRHRPRGHRLRKKPTANNT